VVIASSSSIYGDGLAEPIRETQLPRPISPYAVTKLAAEQLALAYAARLDPSLSVVVLRCFTVYGPGQRPEMLISQVVQAVLEGTTVRIHGDGCHRRDLVYVGDVVRANLLAARMDAAGHAINVGSGLNVSVNEVLEVVGALMGRRVRPVYGARRSGDVTATLADLHKATALLGYRPTTDLRNGLACQIAVQAEASGPGAPTVGSGWRCRRPSCGDSLTPIGAGGLPCVAS
jgi:nucleoside-diphosphate-sugar epimerase